MFAEVFTKVLKDLLFASATAEGNANQKDVMSMDVMG